MKGGLDMAAVGAVTFGAAGAIVGSNMGKKGTNICNSLKIKLTLRDSPTPAYFIDFVTRETKKSSYLYKTPQELLSNIEQRSLIA